LLKNVQNVKTAVLAGELYAVGEGESKLRLGEVMHRIKAPSNDEEEQSIRYAVFDILDVNGEKWTQPYSETMETLAAWFGNDYVAHYADFCYGEDGIMEMWDTVVAGGLEGLVVRSPSIGNRKVKQTFDVDAVVIGITTSGKSWARGEAPALVLAFKDEDGSYRYGGTVGGGLRPGAILAKGGSKTDYRSWWFDEAHKEDLGTMKIGTKNVKMMKPKHVVLVKADEWVVDERPSLTFDGEWTIDDSYKQSPAGQKPRVMEYRIDKSKHDEVLQEDIRLEQIPEMINNG